MALTPAAVWRISAQLVLALDEHLGAPLDSYVNGTQTWLTDEGDAPTLELRLHPAAGFEQPAGLTHYELWDAVVDSLRADPSNPVRVGQEERALAAIWEGLECFPAYGDEIEPPGLSARTRDLVGVPPDAAGLVDHERIGTTWERSRGRASLVDLLFDAMLTP